MQRFSAAADADSDQDAEDEDAEAEAEAGEEEEEVSAAEQASAEEEEEESAGDAEAEPETEEEEEDSAEAGEAEEEEEEEDEAEADEDDETALILSTRSGQRLRISADDLVTLRRIRATAQLSQVPLRALLELFATQAKQLSAAASASAHSHHELSGVLTRAGFRTVMEQLLAGRLPAADRQALAYQLSNLFDMFDM